MDKDRIKVIKSYIDNFIRNNPEVKEIVMSETDKAVRALVNKYIEEEWGAEFKKILEKDRKSIADKLGNLQDGQFMSMYG